MKSTTYHDYLADCRAIAVEAGLLIMQYFAKNFETRHKQDKSPVTDADISANTLIVNALNKLTPHIPVVAEEDEELTRKEQPLFWLVDPLDGTRAFVNGEPEFTVNIGLIDHQQPVMGVIYAPPQQALYWGNAEGAFRSIANGLPERIKVRPTPAEGLTIVRSKSHPSASTHAYLQSLHIKEILPGSSSIKFCQVAEGSADLYPRFGRTMEWDTAAGHAILNAAGGRVETVDGKPLRYGKAGFENPGFIGFGG